MDERKAVWKGLDRTLTEASSNDDLITKLEFTEELSGLSKDTATSPDIKNLSVVNKSELFRLYEDSFTTRQVPENWSHSYLKPVPKAGTDHSKQLNGCRILTMHNTAGKLMEWIVARKLAQGLERRNIPPKPRRLQSRKKKLGKHSQIHIQCLCRIPEEGTNSGHGDRSGRCVLQSAIQTANGTPCTIIMASASRPQDGSQQHFRKERLPCDLETGSPHPNNW